MRRAILIISVLFLGGYLLVSRDTGTASQKPAEIAGARPSVVAKLPAAKPPAPVTPAVPAAEVKKPTTAGGTDFSSALADGLKDAQDLVDQGKPDEALALLRKRTEENPQEPEWRARLGAFLLQEKKDYPAATVELKAAYLANPENRRALRDLAESLTKENNYEKAVATLEQVGQALPKRNEPALALSDLMLNNKDPDGATRVLVAASKNQQADPQITDRLAEAAYLKNDLPAESTLLRKGGDIVAHDLTQPGLSSAQRTAMERDLRGSRLDEAASLAQQGRKAESLEVLSGLNKQDLSKNEQARFDEVWQGVNQ